jgi:4-hydroxy-3-methylbut-2-enyl diphosphate reductase
MDVIVADNAGFCFGVKRAIKMANETLDEASGSVQALGPLIHNPQVVGAFQRRGSRSPDRRKSSPGRPSSSARTASVPAKKGAEERLGVVDTTCRSSPRRRSTRDG